MAAFLQRQKQVQLPVYMEPIMGVVVYKKLSLVQLMGVFSKGVKDVSALVIMFPMTLIFSRLMTLNHIPELVAELMLGITNNRIGLILLIDLLLFFIGFFLDGNVIILTLVPLLTPIATACGIDTIQLAVIVFVSIGIGSITPPMATCLMACSRFCDVPIINLLNLFFHFCFWCITYFAAGIVCSCRINLVAGLVL